MDKKKFRSFLLSQRDTVESIRRDAYQIHDDTNQKYDGKPYSYHLAMVADVAMRFGHEIIENENDIMPVVFSAFFHDSIEDARVTYNDVKKIAGKYMSEEQAFTAAEIVYALTNDKGRTRQERAGEKYYAGIRETPFAPMVKLCDRYANLIYSSRCTNESNRRMFQVYRNEWPHFLAAITSDNSDMRFKLPAGMIGEMENCEE